MAHRPIARTAFLTKSTSTSVAYSLNSNKTCKQYDIKIKKQSEFKYSAKFAQLNGNAAMHQMHERYVNLIHVKGHRTNCFFNNRRYYVHKNKLPE